MASGGRTPEELETLLEDALVLRDGAAFAQLFETNGGLVISHAGIEARGAEAISRSLGAVAESAAAWFAGSGCVYQCGDIALLVGEGSITVARRGLGRDWKIAVSWFGRVR